MENLSEFFCVNKNCKDYGIKSLGNIRTRGRYGANNDKQLLYCLTCGHRFSHSRFTAFFGLRVPDDKIAQVIISTAEGAGIRETGRRLNISKDTVNRIVFRTEEYCKDVLTNLLRSLRMSNEQIDTLISFLENRKVIKK